MNMRRFDTDEISAGRSTLPAPDPSEGALGVGRDRLVSSLEALADQVGERSRLQDVLIAALEVQAGARAQINQLILSSGTAAQEYRSRVAELEAALAEREEALTLARQQISDREQHADSLLERFEQSADDLKRLKRKYRAAQDQAAQQSRLVEKAHRRLAEADAALARYRRSVIWRLYDLFARLLGAAASGLLRPFAASARRKRGRERLNLIRTSSLFDAQWYLSEYPDIAEAGIDPARHYLETGGLEGRDPGPSFSSSDYLKANGDVARAGLNPLVHYLEHGHSEGRGTTDHRPSTTQRIHRQTAFGEAAPCLSFPVEPYVPVRWVRAERLGPNGENLFSAAGMPIGIVDDEVQRTALRLAFERLRQMSTCSDPGTQIEVASESAPAGLLDIWYLSKQQVRTRWSPEQLPLVIRAYQHDPVSDDVLRLIGEGLIVSQTDFVDFSLLNPCFPLLFILSEPDGSVRGSRLLAFPSLCRGGDHYAELLAFAAKEDSEGPITQLLLRYSDVLADELMAIARGDSSPAIAALRINLTATDGSGPLFQADFQTWLAKVFRIQVIAAGDGSAEGLTSALNGAVEVIPARGRRGGSELLLSADMIPSISVLTAGQDRCAEAGEEPVLPLIVAEPDPSQPATLLNLPSSTAAMMQRGATDYPPAWPQLRLVEGARIPNEVTASAIRLTGGRSPNEAELLVPVMEPALAVKPRSEPIGWCIFAEHWEKDTLIQSLEALCHQRDSGADVILFIGPVSHGTEAVAQRLFHQRVRSFSTAEEAASGCDTPLIGFLGAGVLLHDRRCASLLSQLLAESAAISASCVLVSVERRGKAWHVSTADPGTFGADTKDGAVPVERVMWRANYPVLQPPAGLWLASSASVKGWIDGRHAGPRARQIHVCTSQVTASRIGLGNETPAPIVVPDADPSTIVHTRVLFG